MSMLPTGFEPATTGSKGKIQRKHVRRRHEDVAIVEVLGKRRSDQTELRKAVQMAGFEPARTLVQKILNLPP